MARRVHSASVAVTGADTVQSLSISLPQNGGENGQVDFIGTAEHTVLSVGLTAIRDGTMVGSESWSFATGSKSGSDGALSRVRGVTLQDYSAAFEELVGERENIGLPTQHQRYQPVVYDIDKPLGSDLPTGEECEEKARSATVSAPGASQTALEAVGIDLKIIPGPGLVTRDMEDDYSTTGKTVGQVLNELLFTNGVSWWLEGDLVVVDGRALPTGSFDVPASDKDDVVDHSWSDEITTPERAPVLADYTARCAENLITDSGATGTFETNDSGIYPYYESSGGVSTDPDFTYTTGEVRKAGRQIVAEEEKKYGYRTLPGPVPRLFDLIGYSSLTNSYHGLVPAALLSTVETTYAAAEYGALEDLAGGFEGQSALLADLWAQFSSQSPYLQKKRNLSQRWNAEGLLRSRVETTREFSGLLVVGSGSTAILKLLYRNASTTERWLPLGGGLYSYRRVTRTVVDKAIYEGDEAGGAEPAGIMADSDQQVFKEITDSPPPSVSIPLPTCQELDTCLNEAQKEYSRDYADWEARQVNNVSRRVHSLRFGCLKFLKRGDSYGGGRVTDVSHSVTRDSLSTSVSVVVAI